MQVGDLIKFHGRSRHTDDDIGFVVSVQGRDVTLCWAKTGFARSTIDRLLCEKEYFEIISIVSA